MTKPRLRTIAINLILVGLVILALEMLLRRWDTAPTEKQASIHEDDPGEPLYLVKDGRVFTDPRFVAAGATDPKGYIPIDLPWPKPPNTRRIVLVGSSPMRGGTQPGQSTADTLQTALRRLYPETGYRVIDAARAQGFADVILYTVTRLAPLEPDLVIVWPAAAPVIYHDMERTLFGDRGTRGRILQFLKKSHTYQALRELLHEISPQGNSDPSPLLREDPALVDPELSRFLRVLNEAAKNTYLSLLERIIIRTRKAGWPTMVIIPPNCLQCRPPLFSIHAPHISPKRARDFAAFLKHAGERIAAGADEDAVAALRRAVRIDPEYARARWLLGVTLRKTGDSEGARRELAAALTYDASTESVRDTQDDRTRKLAERHHAAVFELEELLTTRLPDAIIGRETMLDQTHLSYDAQLVFTRRLARVIGEMGL